jgi:predicted unusual protein kinase regulating ubiquinone biosynthesis (AarF/ABC1/UbiB family)
LRAYWIAVSILLGYVWAQWAYRFRRRSVARKLMTRRHRRNARRIHKAVTGLQGLFIKVGQLISIMTNFLPEEFRQELETLQDRVPPHPYTDIEARIREEFEGKRPDELFRSFDRDAIAAASIGQVHAAVLEDGTRVAVKVQYPDIERVVRRDLRTLRRIFGLLEVFLPDHGLENVYSEIRAMVMAELDFEQEARNIEQIADSFTDREGVAFPEVVPDFTTRSVLTTTFQQGVKSSDKIGLDAAGISKTELAKLIIKAYCQQIFEDGLYHADPHPGNLLARLDESGEGLEVVFLDFGAVGRVSPAMRRGIAELVQGGIAHDTQAVLRALDSMGFIAKSADPKIYQQIVEFFHQRFHEEIRVESLSFKDIKIDPKKGLESLADLRRMDISLRDLSLQFHVPKEWILLERTLLLLMGLCTELDPDLNPMEVITPYLESFVLGDKDPATFVMDAAKELLLSAVALPGEVRRLLTRLEQGQLEVRFSNLDENVRLLYRLGHQAILAGLAVSAGALAFAFYDRGFERATTWSTGASAALLAWLGLSVFRNRKKRRPRG